jgi:hypothetical protein
MWTAETKCARRKVVHAMKEVRIPLSEKFGHLIARKDEWWTCTFWCWCLSSLECVQNGKIVKFTVGAVMSDFIFNSS